MNKILYDTKYLQLKSTKSKSGHDWVYAHRPNAKDVVVILPIINDEKVLFLKEERPPLQAENIAKYCIGLPAGLVGDERIGESIEDAIKAELISKIAYMITAKNDLEFDSFKDKVSYLESLSAYDFDTFNKAYNDIIASFGLDRKYMDTCPHCKEPVEVEAYIAPDFFRLV